MPITNDILHGALSVILDWMKENDKPVYSAESAGDDSFFLFAVRGKDAMKVRDLIHRASPPNNATILRGNAPSGGN